MDRMRACRVGQFVVAEPGRLALGVLAGHQPDAVDRLLAASVSPRRWAESSGTPCARMAGSAGSRSERQQRPHLVERAGRQHRRRSAPRSPRAVRPAAGRAGWRRSATGRAAARSPARRRGRCRCRARPPRRGRSAGCRWGAGGAAVAGSDLGEPRVQRGWADLLQQGAGLRPRRRAGVGDVREALGQRGEIEAAAAGEDRQPARLARARPFRPSAASRHHATLPGSAAGRTP